MTNVSEGYIASIIRAMVESLNNYETSVILQDYMMQQRRRQPSAYISSWGPET
jgi:hypothetical protein